MMRALLTYWNLHRVSLLLLALSVALYGLFAYRLDRGDTLALLSLYGGLFFLCYKLIQFEKWNLRLMIFSGIALRGVFLLALPNLSQDFYRFLWDGNLLLEGLNPYSLTPEDWMARGGPPFSGAQELYEGMGGLSAGNFSNYPPVNQYFFALAAYLGGRSIAGTLIATRAILLLADLGILYFGRRILRRLNRAPYMIFWYFLNPLVIIELSGNLHFEGVMLCFFLIAMYLLLSGKWLLAAAPYALSIGVKLIPLLFLPLVLPLLGLRRGLGFCLGTALVLGACLYPLYFDAFGPNYAQTLKLWFTNFEFNAGLFNVAEWIAVGQGARPWEFIRAYGNWLPAIMVALTLGLGLLPALRKEKYWFGGALVLLSTYYFLSTTVHPWYIIFPLLLGVFTDLRFALVWSATVVLSYTAYAPSGVAEKPLFLFLEYLPVFGVLGYEIFKNRKNFNAIAKNQAVRDPG